MKLHSVPKSILLSTMIICSVTPAALAQTYLDFIPFVAQDINDSSLSVINVDGLVTDIGTGTRFTFMNNSGINGTSVTPTRPTVTQIYWDVNANFVPTSTTFNAGLSSTTVNYTSGGNPSNLPGGNSISFSADYRYSPTNPQPQRGIDPNETGVFDFQGVNYTDVLTGLSNGTIRIGMHIQEVGINGNDSKSFINQVIPEPSSLLLGLGSLLCVLRRRR